MRCQRIAHPAGLAVVMLAVAASAEAQSELPMPKFEVGIDLTAGDISGGTQSASRVASPRFTVNLSPVWAVDVMMDKATSRTEYASYLERNWLIQARRALYDAGNTRFSALLGSGVRTTRYEFPQDVNLPRALTQHHGLIFAGFGVSQRLFGHAAVNAEVKFFPLASAGFGARTSIGVSVPIGPYPKPAKSITLPFPGSERARVGQTVSITPADGQEVTGALVSATSGSITIARRGKTETFSTGLVRRLDLWSTSTAIQQRGASIGAGVGAGLGLLSSASWLRNNGGEGLVGAAYQVSGLTVLGAAAGAMIGADIDRGSRQRRTIFGR
jgi:hypothetical protein